MAREVGKGAKGRKKRRRIGEKMLGKEIKEFCERKQHRERKKKGLRKEENM